MSEKKFENKGKFVKKPQPGNIVKVYLHENKICYGQVIEIAEIERIDSQEGMYIEEIAVLKKLKEETCFEEVNFFLDNKKVLVNHSGTKSIKCLRTFFSENDYMESIINGKKRSNHKTRVCLYRFQKEKMVKYWQKSNKIIFDIKN